MRRGRAVSRERAGEDHGQPVEPHRVDGGRGRWMPRSSASCLAAALSRLRVVDGGGVDRAVPVVGADDLPADAGWPARRPGRPGPVTGVVEDLDKTLPRLIAGFAASAASWSAVGRRRRRRLWCSETVAISRSAGGASRVTTKARPAMTTARCSRITTGDGRTTPRSSRPGAPASAWSAAPELEAEPAGRALPLPGGAQPAQPADQQRVGLERLGAVDERVEDLVVARRGHVELLADRGLLGAGVLPPVPLELEDLAVAVAEGRLLCAPPRRPGVPRSRRPCGPS